MEKLSILKTKKIFLPNKSNTYNCHFWFTEKGENFMFKYDKKNLDARSLINEVFVSKICSSININCQQASFAYFHNAYGVKIKSFLDKNKGETEINLHDIYNEKYKKQLNLIVGKDFFDFLKPSNIYLSKSKKREHLNNINNDFEKQINYLINCHLNILSCPPDKKEIIEKNYSKIYNLLEEVNTEKNDENVYNEILTYASENNLELDKNFKYHFCQLILFDKLFDQEDRHFENISLIKYNNAVKLAPMFDNGRCLLYSKFFNANKRQIVMTNFTIQELEKNKNLQQDFINLKNFVKNEKNSFIKNFIKKNFDSLQTILPADCNDKNEKLLHFFNLQFNFLQYNINKIENELKKDKELIK